MDFKYIVIGCGVMGNAAAVHLAAASKGVALIGPSEALADTDSAIPKASHHDEGRITRMLDADIFWSHMARRSIDRYRQLEQASGIQFFNECGFLWLDNDPERIRQHLGDGRRVIYGDANDPELWEAMVQKEALLAEADRHFDADRFSELE